MKIHQIQTCHTESIDCIGIATAGRYIYQRSRHPIATRIYQLLPRLPGSRTCCKRSDINFSFILSMNWKKHYIIVEIL